MNPVAVIRRGQRAAKALMRDGCTIRVVTGNTTNPDGTVTPAYGATIYTGRCKIQNQRAFPSTPDAGEHQWTVTPNEIHLPVEEATAAIGTGMILEITASVLDPANVGRKFRIKADDRKSMQTALRVMVEEVVN